MTFNYREPDWDIGFTQGGGSLEKGDYKFCITDAKHDQSTFDQEPWVTIEFTVIEGPCKNRKFWQKYRFANPDVAIAEKAYKKWVNLCMNLGERINPNDCHKMKQRVCNLGIDIFKPENSDKEYPFIAKYIDYENAQKNNTTVQPGSTTAAPATTTTQKVSDNDIPF